MTIHGWKQLTQWSIEHSCLTAEEKKHGLDILKAKWEVFCQWIVDTYGTEAEEIEGRWKQKDAESKAALAQGELARRAGRAKTGTFTVGI